MYRRGVVSAVDVDAHRVRVKFPSKGDVESPWLDVLVPDVLDDKCFSLPSLGAQVAVMLDESEAEGCVVGAIYSQVDAPSTPKNADVRHWTMKDGAKLAYDREAHKLTISLPSGSAVEITADVFKVVGDVEVGSAAALLARADKTDARIDAMQQNIDTHFHPAALGPTGPNATPLGPQDSVACDRVKSD